MARIVAVINQKGGVGKTTSSLEIASILHHRGYKVLVVDMDPQCNISYFSKANMNAYSILDVMLGEAEARGVIQRTEFFDIIVSNGNLASYSMRFTGEKREFRLKEVIDPVRRLYDFIIIDSPPTLGDITVGILTAADSFIIPSNCDIFSIEGIKQIQQTYLVIKQYTNPNLVCDGILVTRYTSNIDRKILPLVVKAAKELELNVIRTPIIESAAIRATLAARMSLYDYKGANKVLGGYEKAVDELLEKWKGETNG